MSVTEDGGTWGGFGGQSYDAGARIELTSAQTNPVQPDIKPCWPVRGIVVYRRPQADLPLQDALRPARFSPAEAARLAEKAPPLPVETPGLRVLRLAVTPVSLPVAAKPSHPKANLEVVLRPRGITPRRSAVFDTPWRTPMARWSLKPASAFGRRQPPEQLVAQGRGVARPV